MALGGLVMIALILSLDLLFFRHRFWERLAANVGIVVVFLGFYFALLRKR